MRHAAQPHNIQCPAAIVGDIAPSDNVTKEVKNQLEAEAMVRIKEMLGAETAAGDLVDTPALLCMFFMQSPVVAFDLAAGQEVEALWQEYEDGQSAEAVMVKDFDKASDLRPTV